MKIGFIGLGKMGGNMVLRLTAGAADAHVPGGEHTVVGYARDPNPDLAGAWEITYMPNGHHVLRHNGAPFIEGDYENLNNVSGQLNYRVNDAFKAFAGVDYKRDVVRVFVQRGLRTALDRAGRQPA